MPTQLLEDTAVEQAAVVTPKQRQCLRCQDTFTSAWSGERICPRCKGSHAWRQGAPVRTHPSSGR